MSLYNTIFGKSGYRSSRKVGVNLSASLDVRKYRRAPIRFVQVPAMQGLLNNNQEHLNNNDDTGDADDIRVVHRANGMERRMSPANEGKLRLTSMRLILKTTAFQGTLMTVYQDDES